VTILPLIERELRTRARGRAVYWTRFAVALVGMLLYLRGLSLSGLRSGLPTSSPAMLGQMAFQNMVVAAFILCCWAGLLTVDRISRERREGTLGLLWLTGVRALDVLLGCFGAAGLTCVCALAAILPVIMLPVLAGGVTGGEAFRTMLVLFDTMLLSLAAGLWASAGARGWFKSARSAVLLLLLVIVLPVVPGLSPYIILVSPLAAFHWAGDAAYRFSPGNYWMSLAAVHVISWLLLIGAGFRLRRAMREEDGTTETAGAASRKTPAPGETARDEVDVERSRAFTLVAWKAGKMPDSLDPVRWLVRRQRGIKAVVWAGALIGMVGQNGFRMLIRMFGAALIGTYGTGPLLRGISSFYTWPVILALGVGQACLFGWAASRFFVEGRRTGELELLLTTPVGARNMISSQWKELRWLFALPVIVLMAPHVFMAALVFQHIKAYGGPLASNYYYYSLVAQYLVCLNALAQIGALIWVGLWFGLRERSQTAALVRIILLCLGSPSVLSLGGSLLLAFFSVPQSTLGFSRVVWFNLLPQLAVLFYYLWLMRWARRRLAAELTNPSSARFSLARSISEGRAALASYVEKARHWPPGRNA
jgi:hypothetical protein